MKKVKKMLKNQKGFTLVELLAVIVILGIISAIAVPSIAGLIDNTKKDAHVANAEQMVAAARLAVASNDTETLKSGTPSVQTGGATAATYRIPLKKLVDEGYLEEVIDPDSDSTYPVTTVTSYVDITETKASDTTATKYTYRVVLKGKERGIVQTLSATGALSKLDRAAVSTTHTAQ